VLKVRLEARFPAIGQAEAPIEISVERVQCAEQLRDGPEIAVLRRAQSDGVR
jgi:hypothetical protein